MMKNHVFMETLRGTARKTRHLNVTAILAVENSIPENEIESAKFLDNNTPRHIGKDG